MKTFIAIMLMSLMTMGVRAQNKLIQAEEVVETNCSKDIMWVNLKKWASTQFNKYKYAVDLEDKEAGCFIVKWSSSFASKTSNYVSLTASATYQIDVKDNKYRIKISDVRVKVDPNVGNTSSMSYIELRTAQADLEFVVEISTSYFNESMSWIIDEKFDSIISEYSNKLLGLSQYANKKQTKINKDWERADRNVNLLKDIQSGFTVINSAIYDSLKKAIINSDDF